LELSQELASPWRRLVNILDGGKTKGKRTKGLKKGRERVFVKRKVG
jgi:hypothetical protein